jgi:transposase InsO family protein
MDVREQRVRFVVAAARGEKSLTSLCQEFGISRPTGYLWLKRYQEAGVAGIAEKSRRPKRSPEQTAAGLEAQVIGARERYPDWGARKLQVILKRENVELTHSTIHRILLRHDLVGEADRHRPAVQRFERSQPNELWQMDFKSPIGWHTAVGPLSVLDDHSRYAPVLQAVGNAKGELVREQLETAFIACGVPEAMLMDHGVPWWNARAATGATRLSVWLMKQGIRLHWSGYRHPQTQGKVERFHGAMQQAWQKRGWGGRDPQAWLDAYRWEYNHVRPHAALGMKTPASVWHKSERRYDPRPPRWEYPSGTKVLKLDGTGKMDAYGFRWTVSQALAGEWVQLERIGQRVLVYYCRTLIRELNLQTQCSTAIERWLEESDC